MKTAIISTVFGIVWLLSLSAHGQSCSNGGGGGFDGGQPPFGGGFPTQVDEFPEVPPVPVSSNFGAQPPAPVAIIAPVAQVAAVSQATSTTPGAPKARISVLGSAATTSIARTTPGVPKARLSLATEPVAPPKADPAVTPAAVEQVVEAEKKPTPVVVEVPKAPEKLPESLQGLVGTWLAVARHSEGELTTVELRLDDRGWAELTVPDKDGKPSTKKSRVGFEDEELKLIGPDATQTLGKLIEQTDRQMVLAQAGSNVTFVRQ